VTTKTKKPPRHLNPALTKLFFFDENDNIYYSTVDRAFNPPLVVQVQPPIKTSFKVSVSINPLSNTKDKGIFYIDRNQEVFLNRDIIIPTDNNGQAFLKWVPIQLSYAQNFYLTFYTSHHEKTTIHCVSKC